MKKIMLALFAVMTLAACTGSYKSGNCEYHYLLHKDISISKIVDHTTGEEVSPRVVFGYGYKDGESYISAD